MPLALQEILQRQRFQWGFVHQGFLRCALVFGLEHETRGKGVLVHALVAAIRAGPEPTVLAVFDGGDEVFADLFGGGFGVAVFREDDLVEFGFFLGVSSLLNLIFTYFVGVWGGKHTFIPVSHIILFPVPLFLLFVLLPCVLIQILLLRFPLYAQIVTKFALLPFFAVPLLVEYAHHRLRVHTKRYLLHLHRLE